MTKNLTLYQKLIAIRRFEETVLNKFPTGVFFGTTHAYLGQEANAVGVLNPLKPGDFVFSNHRCHGHFLAYGGDPRALFAEMMGKSTGVCAGRGGSQHLQWGDFYSNGVQGGIAPIAAGMAMAEKLKKTGAIGVCFVGDGTLGQGVVYEALNMAALWQLPVLYVVEHNQIAQTTPSGSVFAGDLVTRFNGFGIPALELDTSDVLEIEPISADLLAQIRGEGSPRALILHTHRFGPHSKGDDTRDPELVAQIKATRDPIEIHAARLALDVRQSVEAEIENQIEIAFKQALSDPFPVAANHLSAPFDKSDSSNFQSQTITPQTTVLKLLNFALHRALETNENVIILGEDILDPYGGAFKLTQGLSTKFPERVISTPISEAGFVGLAAGLALRGLRPVVEIMFGDFITLAADQIINHIAKFRWMYNDQVRVPCVIRVPMGGRRGYGPTHSQTLEKIMLGIPGLIVLAPSVYHDGDRNAATMLEKAIAGDDPVLFVENKLLYLSRVQTATTLVDFDLKLISGPEEPDTYKLSLKGAPPAQLTLVTYGYMAELAQEAMRQLAYEYEIFVEMIVLTQLAPFELDPVIASAARTTHLLTIEEGTLTLGWGSEVVSRVTTELGPVLKSVQRVAAVDLPVPVAGILEAAVLPGVADIIQATQKLLKA
jgi:2-oxoisovalerate dehydrogenase E1 component